MKLLVLTDLSEAGALSVEALLGMKHESIDEVTLLHVVDLDLYTAGGSIPQIVEAAEEQLARESSRLAERGIRMQVLVEIGDTVRTVREAARRVEADMVVMSALGHGALAGRLLGSTAERIAASLHVPVFVGRVEVCEDVCTLAGEGNPFARMLVATDLAKGAVSVLEAVADLPDLGAVRVVHVAVDDSAAQAARERLGDLVAQVPGLDRAETAAPTGQPAERILAEAEQWRASCIALAPCAHGAMHRLAFGTTARAVARESQLPLLVVPLAAEQVN